MGLSPKCPVSGDSGVVPVTVMMDLLGESRRVVPGAVPGDHPHVMTRIRAEVSTRMPRADETA